MNEKNSRDLQLKKSQHQRRKDARENLTGEKKFVQKHLDDQENERLINLEKKRQEKEYFGKMMEENTQN
jgi:hypothetical protein